MARQPMVTRTIITTNVAVLCVDTEEKKPFETVIVVPRTYKDNKKLMKVVESAVNTDTVKAVKILGTETQTVLYGMTESKFIANADILPDRK